MRRRRFVTLLCGAATAWPLAARAQQPDRMRRIGVLNRNDQTDPGGQAQVAAFREELQNLGWTDGRNTRMDYRSGAGDADLIRKHAAELIALGPDVVLATGGTSVGALQRVSRSVPIVFVNVPIRSAAAWSRASRDRAATPPVLPNSNTVAPRNGWSC